MHYRALVGELVARTPVHVGSGEGEETTDAFFRRDARGRCLIPGTALAGALRAGATRLAPRLRANGRVRPCRALEKTSSGIGPCGCLVCELFGDLYPSEGDDEKTGG